MAWSRKQLANIVRIALLAMLMAVSAPAVSSLLAAACGDNGAAHCHDQPAAHHVVQKCGYCMVQADLPTVPPPSTGNALAVLSPARAAPSLPAPAPAAQQQRLAPPPRAPPGA